MFGKRNDDALLEAWESVKWSEAETGSQLVTLGGQTDFYSRYKLWPHFHSISADPNYKDKLLPVTYVGEVSVQGRRAYVFYDVEPEVYANNVNVDHWDFFEYIEGREDEVGMACVLLEDDFSLPPHLQLQPLAGPAPLLSDKSYAPTE
jgi:hypothetical protein